MTEYSKAQQLASMPPDKRKSILAGLTVQQLSRLKYSWDFWARPNQRPPPKDDDWAIWLLMAGRGFGKSRSGAQLVIEWAEQGKGPIALVARTPGDVRDVMIEGEAGILSISPPWFRPEWHSSKRRLTWPNGVIATSYTSYEPAALRGPQHQCFWADELAAWKYPQETWDMLMFGWRLGDPRGVVTTTPRPIPLMKELLEMPGVHVTRGTTYENRANLAPRFFSAIIKKYEGTILGLQELEAKMIADVRGALWKRATIDAGRVKAHPPMRRVVVAVDPPGSSTGAECGIVVAGIVGDQYYVLDDRSRQGTTNEWGTAAVTAYVDYQADRIVGEVNNGGDMVEHVIRSVAKDMGISSVSYSAVRASRGKYTRAEPVAALYEQGRVHHPAAYPELEDQMCTWVPGNVSPDRLDAMVWALTELETSGTLTAGISLPNVGARSSPWRI